MSTLKKAPSNNHKNAPQQGAPSRDEKHRGGQKAGAGDAQGTTTRGAEPERRNSKDPEGFDAPGKQRPPSDS